MFFSREKLFLFSVCAAFYAGITVLFVIYCCRILLKCAREYSDMEENHPKKACEFDSQTETSVYMDESRRGTINEGYLVDISVEDNDMKTFSNVDRINDGHFSHQLPVINEEEERGQDMFENIQNHEEASLGLTRFNNDGSVDTRF